MSDTIRIEIADKEEDLAQAVALCNGFLAWVRERYADRAWLVDLYYPDQEWQVLLGRLGTIHAPPAGAILLARQADRPVGCIMLTPHAPGICEMKRLFVLPEGHGKGIGRALCQALLRDAATRGYHTMRLETGVLQPEAATLYESLGFVRRSHYNTMPESMHEHVISMERPLDPASE